MNKRIYYKKLKQFIKKNLNTKIYANKIVYTNHCILCKNKIHTDDYDCHMECDGLGGYYYEFQNTVFNNFIRKILGNIITNYDDNYENKKLKHNYCTCDGKLVYFRFGEDYIEIPNKYYDRDFKYFGESALKMLTRCNYYIYIGVLEFENY